MVPSLHSFSLPGKEQGLGLPSDFKDAPLFISGYSLHFRGFMGFSQFRGCPVQQNKRKSLKCRYKKRNSWPAAQEK
jgi:hypothetical protein